MKRRTKGPALDISIHGDELEQHRIQLENNLQQTDLSFRLSSASDDENNNYYHNNSSVEYPRHDSGPSPFPEFPSFAHRSRDFYSEEDPHSQMRGWSYRTGDDEEGINPYGGETMSTAAHHASALTLNAGLGGGRGARRELSMSGAEYDPDRPLNQIMAGVGRMSMLDLDSKSKTNGLNSVTFDPVVVDSTAELDRILQSGYAHPHSLNRSVHPTPPMSSASSSTSDSDPARSPTSRPKLSDHLRHVSFSPKRPRSAQSHHTRSPAPQISPLANRTQNSSSILSGGNMPTPRPAKRSNIHASVTAQPEVRLQPPTPSNVSSNFTRMARGITKEIAQTQNQDRAQASRPTSAPPLPAQRKSGLQGTNQADAANGPRQSMSRRSFARENSRSKIVLPDVTGLTSAVESPAKAGKDYYPYRSNTTPRDSEARLVQTLSTVQSKLHYLNEENGISRRRVRELEMELEECKREVTRERTRLLEREELIVQQQRDLSNAAGRNKGKGKARDASGDAEEGRYKEAVEEKKALEALINSLRTHLTRLTSELATHQELLVELRSLRDSDSRALQDKGIEIVRLKDEVERLAGEVEVLRGVVEEGLRERRASKEVSTQEGEADLAMSADLEEDDDRDDDGEDVNESDEHQSSGPVDESDEEAEPFDPSSIQGSSRANVGLGDRTMRTDRATLGSSSNFADSTAAPPRVQFIDNKELERIAAEVEERRSDLSLTESMMHVAGQGRARTPSPIRINIRTHEERQEDSFYVSRPPSPTPTAYQNQRSHQPTSTLQPPKPTSSSRPIAVDDDGASHAGRQPDAMLETPFPRIRGDHLERLFFSAPEHNPKTCTVCYRRRHRSDSRAHHSISSLPHRGNKGRRGHHIGSGDESEDEGFAEGPEGTEDGQRAQGKYREDGHPSMDPTYYRTTAQKAGLPPQTVVMRVIRELEDDFTHYKSVYVELADQYKDMDAVSDVPRRNMLAQHLREVVDVLEQKGNQIASLYDLLSFKDKPISESIIPPRRSHQAWQKATSLK